MSAPILAGPPPVKNPRHRLLADTHLRGISATQAAIDVGYKERSANVIASQIINRPDVQAYIAWNQSQQTTDTQDIREQIDAELRDLAFANIDDFTTVDEDGQLKPDFTNATRAQMKAVTSVGYKVSKRYDKDGNHIGTEKQSRFGFIDKTRAVELLGKFHGLFNQDELKVTVDVADRLLAARKRVSLLSDDSVDD